MAASDRQNEFLHSLNTGRLQPESTMTLEQFWDGMYWPYVQRQKRPSTARSYSQPWKDYVEVHCRATCLRDFRCFDGERIPAEIDQRHQLIHSRLKRVKNLLNGMFKHAKRKGVLHGINPMQDMSIPQGQESKETHAHSLEEITRMLAVLSKPGSTAMTMRSSRRVYVHERVVPNKRPSTRGLASRIHQALQGMRLLAMRSISRQTRSSAFHHTLADELSVVIFPWLFTNLAGCGMMLWETGFHAYTNFSFPA
ncbi:MAG: hypothetical protein V3T65_02560 [Acidobacteriota bacterium]